MAVIEIAKIQVRRGQENLTGMPQLDSGEFGWAEDTEHLYIGKRIADGAADDKNARILTETDLVNIFAAIESTSTTAVYYKYRQDVDYINTASVAQTIQKKLDDSSPSLTDFGVVQEFSGTDITLEFKLAVETIFMNGLTSDAYQRSEARRTLRIPAGSYTVSQPIDLPPYARIVGEGPGLTVITATGPSDLFRTVDASGNSYDDMVTMTDASLPKDIHIEGMTLQCSTASAYTASIISLDNVNGANVVDCHIGSQDWETTSSVFPFGSCISIRGNLGNGAVGDNVQCKNIYINDCELTGLGVGIATTGTVIRPIIENNLFATLLKGITFEKGIAGNSPTNGTIVNNRFQNIEQYGIYVGTDTIRTNHLSSNNFFINVGNGYNQYSDNISTSSGTTAIIAFNAPGNKSVNDYFYRRDFANSTTTSTFYYAPLVTGSTSLDDDSTYTVSCGTGTTNVSKFVVNGGEQFVSIRYQIYGINSLTTSSRKGTMVINLTPSGQTHIADTYDYVDELNVYGVSTNNMTAFVTTGSGSGPNLACFNTSTYIDLPVAGIEDGTWYLTGNNVYLGKAAQILAVTGIGTATSLTSYLCDSANPTFDFATPGETWTLLKAHNPAISFTSALTASKNYVTLYAVNASTTTYKLEYQVNIVQ